MTVAELKTAMAKMPDDAVVVVPTGKWGAEGQSPLSAQLRPYDFESGLFGSKVGCGRLAADEDEDKPVVCWVE